MSARVQIGPITVKYGPGHSLEFTYSKTEYFCPQCGKQTVWEESGEGDYYYGPAQICVAEGCNSHFSIIDWTWSDQNAQVCDAILEGVKS